MGDGTVVAVRRLVVGVLGGGAGILPRNLPLCPIRTREGELPSSDALARRCTVGYAKHAASERMSRLLSPLHAFLLRGLRGRRLILLKASNFKART